MDLPNIGATVSQTQDTGLRCTNTRCGFMATNIPSKDIAMLKAPSATVECPACHTTQPAIDCFVAFERTMQAIKTQIGDPMLDQQKSTKPLILGASVNGHHAKVIPPKKH